MPRGKFVTGEDCMISLPDDVLWLPGHTEITISWEEEPEKLEKIDVVLAGHLVDWEYKQMLARKLNELVNAVNELREANNARD